MKTTIKNEYVVYLDGVDFDHMTDDQWMEIGKIHMSNLVTIIRNCNVGVNRSTQWIKKWGRSRSSGLMEICKSYPDLTAMQVIQLSLKRNAKILPAHADVIINRFKTKGPNSTQRISDIRDKNGDVTGVFPGGELKWHSNEAGNHIFGPGVSLLGEQNMIGSSTGFLQTASYYQDVSESFRSELDDMIVIHRHKPDSIHVKDLGDQAELLKISMTPKEENHIPMVILSPGGIKGLHYSINTVDGIVGMSRQESDKLFARMNKELMVDKYMCDHWYEHNNDWLFFDNSITNHRRLGEIPNRLAYRTQHDYEFIQVPNYNPYFQKEHAEIYTTQLNKLHEFMKENNLNE